MYQDLLVWQKSMELVKQVYILVEELPKKENYVLSDQMRRAAISIPSNIAEGSGRSSRSEYKRFLEIAPVVATELSKIQNIVAIKEASGNLSQVTQIAHLCGDNLHMYHLCMKHQGRILSVLQKE